MAAASPSALMRTYYPCGPVVSMLQTRALRNQAVRQAWVGLGRRIRVADEADLEDTDLSGRELWQIVARLYSSTVTEMLRKVAQIHKVMESAQPPKSQRRKEVEKWLQTLRSIKPTMVTYCDQFMANPDYLTVLYCSSLRHTNGIHVKLDLRLARNLALTIRPFVFTAGIFLNQDLRGRQFLAEATKYFTFARLLLSDLTDVLSGLGDGNVLRLLMKDAWSTYGNLCRLFAAKKQEKEALAHYHIFLALDLVMRKATVSVVDSTDSESKETPLLDMKLALHVAKQQEPSLSEMLDVLPGHSLKERSNTHTEFWFAVCVICIVSLSMIWHAVFREKKAVVI